jgi:threonine synthase
MPAYVTCLESAIAPGVTFSPGRVYSLHEGRPLWVRYDLDAVRNVLAPTDLVRRSGGLWRYRELLPLPLEAEPVTLDETTTPSIGCPRLGARWALAVYSSRTNRVCQRVVSSHAA